VADRPVSPLAFERSVLPDGAELVAQPAPTGAASFAVSYLGPAGWAFEPRDRSGLAVLASELAVCGAGRLDRRAVAQLLDRSGGTLGSQCHPECTEVTLWGPLDHFRTLLPLLADAVRRPRFEPGELARVRRQFAERQLRERTQPDRRAEKELLLRMFPPAHPYRETGLGTAASLRSLGRADLTRFHRARQRWGGEVLAYTGPLSAEQFERAWGRAGGLAESSRPRPPVPETTARPRPPSIERIEVPGGSQVEVRIGGPAIARHDPGFAAAFLANEVLGGRSVLSRLFQELRERRGLVYHALSSLEAMSWGGYWSAEAGTEPRSVDTVLSLLDQEVRRLGDASVPAEELDRIRTSSIGSLALELESTADAHELAVEVAYYRLPLDFYLTWPAVLRALSPGEVRDAARRVFDPDRAVRVLAGPLSGAGAPPRAAG
jgi:zinc protease